MRLLRVDRSKLLVLFAASLCSTGITSAAPPTPGGRGNDPAALEEFQDLALGLFVHWSIDVQHGSVISHSLVGADRDYQERYFRDLPKTFNPVDYDPARWAELARVCGFRYAVLTTKHHNGFCLFPTSTTEFNVTRTRYGKDIVGPYVRAFRDEGLRVGFYFSPEDFWVLHKQGRTPARAVEHGYTQTSQNPELKQHNLAQVGELLAGNRPIDMWFFDSREAPEELKELVWSDNPKTIVTRGEIATPEQNLRGGSAGAAWEACFTLGDQWQFRGTNERYKSAGRVIDLLIETRARGGNLLLNVGPDAYGRIPAEQEAVLRELGLWLFINHEAVYEARPWRVDREGDVWFTRSKQGDAVYLFLTNQGDWPLGERREFHVEGVSLTKESTVNVLGHGGEVLEYTHTADPSVGASSGGATPAEGGVTLSVMRAQRIYNDRKWPNPIVVKLTHPGPALQAE